MISVVRVFFI